MLSVDESSLVESKPIPSLDLTHEPSLRPWTLKERAIHSSEFPIEFEDYGNTSKLSRHKKLTLPSPKVEPSKEWLMELRHSFEAIWILSPSIAMPCLLRGAHVEALHNPMVKANIMSESLAKTLLGDIPLVSTNKLFKSPSGLIFDCCGITRAVLIKIDKTEVH